MSVQRKVPMKLFWVAGGIGITPFLAMLIPSYSAEHEITLLLFSREPDVMLSLLSSAIEAAAHEVKLVVMSSRTLNNSRAPSLLRFCSIVILGGSLPRLLLISKLIVSMFAAQNYLSERLSRVRLGR
jgi:ferredoxin-NADP reductase